MLRNVLAEQNSNVLSDLWKSHNVDAVLSSQSGKSLLKA